MNSDLIFTTCTTNSDETRLLGARLAKLLRHETIELIGDIGSGKTTFTQGLAQGLGYMDNVTSPTFTLNRQYSLGDGRKLDHYDLYRLNGYDIASQELEESIVDEKTIVIVEWSSQGEINLPVDRIQVIFELGENENERQIKIAATSIKLKKIIEALNATTH